MTIRTIFIICMLVFSLIHANQKDSLLTLAKGGNTNVQVDIGAYYCSGVKGFERDLEKAAFWFKEAAEKGNAVAQYNLGMLILSQDSISSDEYEKAFDYFSKSAGSEYVEAYSMLAHCYYNGYGTSQVNVGAFEWWKKAAEEGDTSGQYALGLLYFYGHCGVSENKYVAIEWWKKAAKAGHSESQYQLGLVFFNGIGVEESKWDAANYFTQAANSDHAQAQYALGKCYALGAGVTKSPEKALSCWKMAAKQGDKDAQLAVAEALFKGEGCKQDTDLALSWYEKAASNGSQEAQKFLDENELDLLLD